MLLRKAGTVFLRFTALTLSGSLLLPAAPSDASLKIVVLEGNGAINNIRERTAKAPAVRVEDENGRPLAGATVNFVLPDFGAGGFFADGHTTLSTTTDSSGQAIGRGLRPNNVAGRFQIRVSAMSAGRTASTMITQTNAVPSPAHAKPTKKIVIAGLVAGAVAGTLFAVKGSGNSSSGPATPASPGTTITPGSPVFGPPR